MNCTIEVGRIGAYINIRWIKNKRDEVSTDRRPFLPTVINEIEKRRGLTGTSTLENELTAVRSFAKYIGRSLVMDDLTPELIRGYERWLLNRSIKPNTSACYLRSLRAVLNRCGADGSRLFGDVRTGKETTKKRAADEDTLRRIKNIQLQEGHFLSLARDAFLFSIMAMGIPFIDLAHLKKSDVKDGFIVYNRKKTGRQVTVKMEPCMQEIIDRYSNHDSPYLFPLLRTGSEKEYNALLCRYNRALAELSAMMGLPLKLTSYTARHTWASMAYKRGVPLAVISKALGHSSPVTTLAYLKEIDDTAIEQANKRLLIEFNGRT